MPCSFSPLAEIDLEEIADYIARDNPRRALSFVRELRERCEKIAAFPEAARLRPELAEGIRLVAEVFTACRKPVCSGVVKSNGGRQP